MQEGNVLRLLDEKLIFGTFIFGLAKKMLLKLLNSKFGIITHYLVMVLIFKTLWILSTYVTHSMNYRI